MIARARRWAGAGLLGATLLAILPSCGSDPPPRAAPRKESVAAWADVFDGTPDLFAVIRPQALKRDGVYGAFWKSLVRVVEARGFARGTTMIEAVEGAEEIILGLSRGADAALVLRGVPASLDPGKIVDGDGKALFRPTSDRAKVVEYELVNRKDADAGALFVLPQRTWVGALGEARLRARQAFATPMNRPIPELDPKALAAVRVGGRLAHALERHPMFEAVSRRIVSATFALKPGKEGLVVALLYEDPDAAAWAEMHGKTLLAELAKDEKRYGWLKDGKVAYEGNTVFVRLSVPPRLLEELPTATSADFAF